MNELNMMNSYATLEQANAFHALRPSLATWQKLSDADKWARLVAASDVLDTLPFRGAKADPHQVRQFPRVGMADVPMAVVQAVAFLAAYPDCLGGLAGGQDGQSLSQLSSVKIGELQVSYQSDHQAVMTKDDCLTWVRAWLADWLLSERRMGAILVSRGCGCGA